MYIHTYNMYFYTSKLLCCRSLSQNARTQVHKSKSIVDQQLLDCWLQSTKFVTASIGAAELLILAWLNSSLIKLLSLAL